MPVCCYECLPSDLISDGTNSTLNNCLTDAMDEGTLKRCDSMSDVCASGTMSKLLRNKYLTTWLSVFNIISNLKK